MAITAQFPLANRQIERGLVNPLDKTTVISVFPREIKDSKPTLFPGNWTIPPGSLEKPSVTVIGPSSWFRDLDDKAPIIEIPVSSIQIAESIIRDYCGSLVESTLNDAMPGIFFLPGELNINEVKLTHKAKLDYAYKMQRAWFDKLVRVADALYARSNGNPIAISDDMRLAAKELGIENRDWVGNYKAISMVKCIACGYLRDPSFPVCPHCHAIIDMAKAKELKLEFLK